MGEYLTVPAYLSLFGAKEKRKTFFKNAISFMLCNSSEVN